VKRRDFVLASAATAACAFGASFLWRRTGTVPALPGPSPYGPLAASPDASGLRLPAGFTSRVVAVSGSPVENTGYTWHAAPDGGACFAEVSGGWAYVSNSELPLRGGASVIHFDTRGRITSSRAILSGTNANCAGGPTPWGTWLSCEEWDGGRVFECYLDGRPARALADLGRFAHEAAAVDPAGGRVYLTEDRQNGRFYRFTPERYPELEGGVLEAAQVTWSDPEHRSGAVTWTRVEKWLPASLNPFTARKTTAFDGGEGCWYDAGLVYFATKGDGRIWIHDPARGTIRCLYTADRAQGSPLRSVDNIVVSPSGDLFVAEDGGGMRLVMITPEGGAAPFLELVGHEGSEITGPAFTPGGDRLLFSSQRGAAGSGRGMTFEVEGPFRTRRAV
jgi:secreted PhoX family phosphatase